MADNSYVKMSVHYAEEEVTITSNSISAEGERIIVMGDDFGLIPHRSVVDAVGYLEDGIIFIKAKVTLSTDSQLNLEVINTESKQERRNFLKVKIYMATRVVRAFSLGKSQKSYIVNERVMTRDISLGGVAFYSNRRFLKKQRIELDFNILKPGFIAEAQVLRRDSGPFRGGYRFKYGCCFLNISGEEERVLCEFVFKTQLENHKKTMHRGL